MTTHYERLGIAVDASAEDVRLAFRRAAQANHPDTHGDVASARMAEINAAWWVLQDPARRREYDRSIEADRHTELPTWGPAERASGPDRDRPVGGDLAPARFPWRLMALMATVGIVVILIGVIVYEPAEPPLPDNLLTAGSCVSIQVNGDAAEVRCADPHDGTVVTLVPIGDPCPLGTAAHRDKQGMGTACISP